MATKKSMLVLFGVLIISTWVLGSAIQAGAETLKGRLALTVTKNETISVNDEEGHVLGLQIMEGLAFFENGEIAKMRNHNVHDLIPGKGGQAISYNIWTFEDGSIVVNRTQRLMVADQSGNLSAKVTSEFVKGTGRFEGIKGTGSAAGKGFPASKGEAGRQFMDFTWTYTLPSK
jgi:hypothetical protein